MLEENLNVFFINVQFLYIPTLVLHLVYLLLAWILMFSMEINGQVSQFVVFAEGFLIVATNNFKEVIPFMLFYL